MYNDNRGVSKIIGVVILVVIVIMLSVGVLFTAQTLIGDQPKEMTAGTTDERVDFYTHEAQLVNQGNTDTVYAISPLGTEYKLEDAGDLQKILPLKKGSHPGVDQYQIVGERDGQRQLLKTSHFEEGVRPDVVVHDEGDKDYETIQDAINNIEDDTERDISSENPGVIVVQKGVYKENIEVTDDITLIAEYGTVIEDANPNEDVVDIRGDNVRFQNFEVDGNPNPDDKQHYARHGINVQGSDAIIQGNTIYRADSPDVTSAAVRINGENSLVRYNNMRDSQQSIHFGSGSSTPAVCGNQFENGIGGSVTSQTQKDVATLNHWNGGMPSNLARTVIAAEQADSEDTEETTFPGEAPKELLENTNSRIDPSVLGEDAGRAALPFTGTKIGSSSSPGECELSISLTNTDSQSISIEEIEVTINGKTTTIEVVQEVNLGQTSTDTGERDGPTASCDCGGDGTYDPGDRISFGESSFGEIQTYTTEGTLEPLPFTEGEGSEPTPSSFNVQTSSGSTVTTTSSSEPTRTTSDTSDNNEDETTNTNDGGETQDFTILLGSSVDINLADEVVLEPVVVGSEGEPEYEWDLGDGTTSTDEVVRHVYDEKGTYTVTLTVTDPATGETDTDSTTVTVQEGTKDVEKIQSDEQQRLADLVEEDPDGDGKVLYLEEGVTYTSLSTINAQDLTIIGQGDNVVLDGPITVASSGVTFKNVAINGGLTVNNDQFKLYNSEVSNSDGYAVELNSNGGGFQIGDSKLSGDSGVYVGVDRDVLISGNTIDASQSYGIYTEEDISNVRIRDNTITSNDVGIYEALAVESEYEQNDITAPTTLKEQQSTDPVINDISVEFTTTDVPVALSTQVSDPDGYGINEVTWEVDGNAYTRSPGNDLIYTFNEPGEHTISLTVTDSFGNTVSESKTIQVEEFEATLTTSKEASVNDKVTASVDYNIPDYRVQSFDYNWGNGETDTVGNPSYTNTYTETGTYDISVTVNPDEGESRTVTKSIDIVDSPVADFAVEDPLNAGEPITFNGAYSTSPDGGSLDYTWNMGDGTTYTSESPQHTYATTGTYTVTLTVEGSDGYTDSTSVNLEVLGFTTDVTGPGVVGVGEDAEFDVSSSIGDSSVDSYILDVDGDGQGDAQFDSSPFTYTFTSEGTREVTVDTIKDGVTIRDTVTVEVYKKPSFDLTTSSTSVEEGTEISFAAENVQNADNPTYNWDFDDGTTKNGKSVTHTYTSGGLYTATVTVTNDNGVSKTKSVDISVDSQFSYEYTWDASNGDTYSTFTDMFTVVDDTGVQWDDQSSYVRWADNGDGTAHYKKEIQSSSSRIRVDYKFMGYSYEGSGARIYAVDNNGNKDIIMCDAGGSISCSHNEGDRKTYRQQEPVVVKTSSEYQSVHYEIDMANVHDTWYDEARLYSLKIDTDPVSSDENYTFSVPNGDDYNSFLWDFDKRDEAGVMVDTQSNYIRWAELDGDGTARYVRSVEANNGQVAVDYKFQGQSYEGSGARIYVEDRNGNTYNILCDDGRNVHCSTNLGSFTKDETVFVDAEAEITKIHYKVSALNVHGEWYDEARLYDLSIDTTPDTGTSQTDTLSISNPTSNTYTDQAVQVKVQHKSGMQNDFDDLRFYQNGNEVDYWVNEQETVNGDYAIVWVEANSISSSGASLTMEYGHNFANSKSSGQDTFVFFDNFDNDGKSFSEQWNVVSGSYSVADHDGDGDNELLAQNNNQDLRVKVDGSTYTTKDGYINMETYSAGGGWNWINARLVSKSTCCSGDWVQASLRDTDGDERFDKLKSYTDDSGEHVTKSIPSPARTNSYGIAFEGQEVTAYVDTNRDGTMDASVSNTDSNPETGQVGLTDMDNNVWIDNVYLTKHDPHQFGTSLSD